MKKLPLRFAAVFCAVLLLSYVVALFRPEEKTQEKSEQRETRSLTSPKVHPLHAKGLARCIGVSNSRFRDLFGEPGSRIDSVEGVEWWNYEINGNDYVRVGIDKYTKKVCDIIELSSRLDQPVSVGMKMSQVLKKTTLYANFALEVNEQQVQIELSEHDLNNHPLVSFDNGSYAILDFAPGRGRKVYAIHYLDRNELLKGEYYRVLSKTPLPSRYTGSIDWERHDDEFGNDLVSQLNVKRLQAGRVPVECDYNAGCTALDVLNLLTESPEKYLGKGELAKYRRMQAETFEETGIFFRVPGNAPKALLRDAGVPKEFSVYVVGPVLTNTVFYTDNKLYESVWKPLCSPKTGKVGVAFRKTLAVIVVGN